MNQQETQYHRLGTEAKGKPKKQTDRHLEKSIHNSAKQPSRATPGYIRNKLTAQPKKGSLYQLALLTKYHKWNCKTVPGTARLWARNFRYHTSHAKIWTSFPMICAQVQRLMLATDYGQTLASSHCVSCSATTPSLASGTSRHPWALCDGQHPVATSSSDPVHTINNSHHQTPKNRPDKT